MANMHYFIIKKTVKKTVNNFKVEFHSDELNSS